MAKYQLLSPRSRKSRLLLLAGVLVIILVGGIITMREVYFENLKPLNNSQRTQLITVANGSSAKDIASLLKEKGIIRASWAFEWYVRTNEARDKLQAGTYSLRPNQSIPDIVVVLTQGSIATDLVTILPGQRLDQIKQSLIHNGFSEDAVAKAFNPKHYANHPALVDKPADANLEGYLYPESFQKTAETDPTFIIKSSLDQMQKHLTPEVRAGFVRQGLTVHQGVILASIIEQEVSKTEDKAKVAQVFLSRLRQDMPLGSDVTAFYGAILDGVKPSVIYDSPYNTRIHKGFPPGPISNVSQASLDAVARPAQTDYLYFVAGDDGTTYFSHTVEEHEALTKQHCTKLCN